MKLMIVTHNMDEGYGERAAAQLVRGFVRQGVECTLVTESGTPPFYELPESVHQVYLSFEKSVRASKIPRAYKKLRRVVRSQKPDLVLALSEKVNVWTALWLIGTRVPLVVCERRDPRAYPQSRVKRVLRRALYPFLSGFVFQSTYVSRYFTRPIRARGAVLDEPFDAQALPPRYTGARESVIATVGRFDPERNQQLLIRAFAKFYKTHHAYTLKMYGEGPELENLTRLASSLGIAGAVEFAAQTEKTTEEINRCAAFALSSSREELPVSLIEAMAQGVCCIATDCPIGNARALIRDQENGLLVQSGSEKALLSALMNAADDTALNERLGRNAVRIRERLEETRVTDTWLEYLETVLERSKRARGHKD